jgi:hypothetical protein
VAVRENWASAVFVPELPLPVLPAGLSAGAGITGLLPNAGRDLVDLPDLPVSEREPLDAANAIGVAA